MHLDRKLATLASSQRMLVTADDVRLAGGNRNHIRRRVAAGRWEAVLPGVYRIAGGPPPDWPTMLLATILAAGPGAAASHLAAARLWGIPGFSEAGVEVSVPRHRLRRRDARVHESTDLDRCEIVRRDGVPVTDPGRTILDLARYVGPGRLTRSIEHLRRQGLVDWHSLIGTLAAHARRGRHGVRLLREVILANADRSDVTDTDMELLVLGLMREHGLPDPVLHHRIFDGERFVAEVDLAYPDLKIAIECDGSVHLEEDVRDRDLPRQNDLVLLGWTVLRFSYRRVRDRPDAVVRDIRDAINAARVAV